MILFPFDVVQITWSTVQSLVVFGGGEGFDAKPSLGDHNIPPQENHKEKPKNTKHKLQHIQTLCFE